MGLKEFYTATGAKIFGTASTVKTIGAAAAASAVIAGAAAGVHAFTSGRDFTPDGAGRAIRTNQVHFDGSENTIGRQDEQTKTARARYMSVMKAPRRSKSRRPATARLICSRM